MSGRSEPRHAERCRCDECLAVEHGYHDERHAGVSDLLPVTARAVTATDLRLVTVSRLPLMRRQVGQCS